MIRRVESLLLVAGALPGLLWLALSMTIESTGHYQVDRPAVALLRSLLIGSALVAASSIALAVRWFFAGRVRGPFAAAACCLAIAFLGWAIPLVIGVLGAFFR